MDKFKNQRDFEKHNFDAMALAHDLKLHNKKHKKQKINDVFITKNNTKLQPALRQKGIKNGLLPFQKPIPKGVDMY